MVHILLAAAATDMHVHGVVTAATDVATADLLACVLDAVNLLACVLAAAVSSVLKNPLQHVSTVRRRRRRWWVWCLLVVDRRRRWRSWCWRKELASNPEKEEEGNGNAANGANRGGNGDADDFTPVGLVSRGRCNTWVVLQALRGSSWWFVLKDGGGSSATILKYGLFLFCKRIPYHADFCPTI
jgi:hypothetical protein